MAVETAGAADDRLRAGGSSFESAGATIEPVAHPGNRHVAFHHGPPWTLRALDAGTGGFEAALETGVTAREVTEERVEWGMDADDVSRFEQTGRLDADVEGRDGSAVVRADGDEATRAEAVVDPSAGDRDGGIWCCFGTRVVPGRLIDRSARCGGTGVRERARVPLQILMNTDFGDFERSDFGGAVSGGRRGLVGSGIDVDGGSGKWLARDSGHRQVIARAGSAYDAREEHTNTP